MHTTPRQEVLVEWSPPPHDWVKMNTDGSFKGNPILAQRVGEVLFAILLAFWISGFAMNIGICSSLAAELWGLLIRLQLTGDNGYCKSSC